MEEKILVTYITHDEMWNIDLNHPVNFDHVHITNKDGKVLRSYHSDEILEILLNHFNDSKNG